MTHRLKALGCALVAMLAMSAVGATMASAAEETKAGLFTASVGAGETAKGDAVQIGAGDKYTINGLVMTCGTATGTGQSLTKGPSSTEVTATATAEGCHVVVAGLTKLVTVTENGCSSRFNATTTVTESGFDLTATATLECPQGKQVEIHVYSGAASEATTLCTYDVKPQGPLSGITLTNKVNRPAAANDVVADINMNISMTNTIKSAICGQNEIENASYKGEDTIQSTNEAGVFVDASASS